MSLIDDVSLIIKKILKISFFQLKLDTTLKSVGTCRGSFKSYGWMCEIKIAPQKDTVNLCRVLLHEITHALKIFEDKILSEKVAEYVSTFILFGENWVEHRTSINTWGNNYFRQDERKSLIHTASWENARLEGEKLMTEYKTFFEKLEDCILEYLTSN